MSCGDDFLNTLRKLNFPEVNNYEGADFDSFFEKKELSSFLECFCNLNEDNVLTADEVAEYAALTPDELARIDVLEKSGYVQENDSAEVEKKREVQFLTEHLAHIKKHNEALEKQMELFKKHEEKLLEEKENCQKLLQETEKKFQNYCVQKIPEVEDEFVASLQSIADLIQEVEALFSCSDDESMSSSSMKKDIENYIKVEEELLKHVSVFLQNNFEYKKNENMFLLKPLEGMTEERLKEISFLQKALKSSALSKIKAGHEVRKCETILKCYEQFDSDVEDFDNYPSTLKHKIQEVEESIEKNKKEEEELFLHLSQTIGKHVDAECNKISKACANHVMECFNHFLDALSLPLDTLVNQRARIELLLNYLKMLNRRIDELKKLIEKACDQLERERTLLLERKAHYEDKINEDIPERENVLTENSLFTSLFKIMAEADDLEAQDVQQVSVHDVLKKAEKFHEAKAMLKEKYEDKFKKVESMEKHMQSMEKLISLNGTEYSKWFDLEKTLNVELNNLDIKMTSLLMKIAELQQYFEEQQKLVERKSNLRMARILFVYALTNKELFAKCIEDIKGAIKDLSDGKTESI